MKRPFLLICSVFPMRLFHICLCLLYAFAAIAGEGNPQADSLKKQLHAHPGPGTNRAGLLLQLADALKESDYSGARVYATEALDIAKAGKHQSLLARSYHLLGRIEDEQSRFDSAIYYYQLAISFFNGLPEKKELACTLNEQGIAFENKGDYRSAYHDYLSSLKLYEELKDRHGIANEHLNLGLIHQYRNELNIARRYFSKALALSQSIADEGGIASALNNLGINYLEEHLYDSSLICFMQVLAIDMRSGDEQNIASSLNNVGTVSSRMGKYAEALGYYQRSASIKERSSDYIGLSNTYNNIAASLISLGRLQEAEGYLDRSKKLSDTYSFKNNIVETYETYYQLELARKNYKKALGYYKLYKSSNDSIRKYESELAIHHLENQYQLDKANTEIALKNAQLEGVKQHRLLYFLIIGLLIAVSVYLYFNGKRIRHLNKALNRQQADLIEAKEKAEEATKVKSRFLSVMSHEIRTPLNAIIGVANLLSDEIKNAAQQENIKVLHAASRNLMSLINDLLDLSKLEVGKMQVDPGNIRLKKICENIREMFAVLATQKGIFLKLEFDEEIPEVLNGDEIKLNQAITNLVGNAIKFTRNGSVYLSVKLVDKDKDHVTVLFAVTDTGIGIPPDRQQSVFDSFIQASADTNTKFGGTGLGLSISKRLVEVMGGKLELYSEEGKGSAFSFQLVFANEKETVAREHKQKKYQPELYKGKHILIADDNPVNVFVLKQFLHKWGATTAEATDGSQVLPLLRANRFDMVLMDIQMPEKDGLQASREIRSSGESWSNIPIIAITASHEEEVKVSIGESGMNDFVIKPFMPDELVAKISRLI